MKPEPRYTVIARLADANCKSANLAIATGLNVFAKISFFRRWLIYLTAEQWCLRQVTWAGGKGYLKHLPLESLGWMCPLQHCLGGENTQLLLMDRRELVGSARPELHLGSELLQMWKWLWVCKQDLCRGLPYSIKWSQEAKKGTPNAAASDKQSGISKVDKDSISSVISSLHIVPHRRELIY